MREGALGAMREGATREVTGGGNIKPISVLESSGCFCNLHQPYWSSLVQN